MLHDTRDDTELLAASAELDADAFAVLVRRHIRSATMLAAQLLGDRDEAEDVVQVAFTIVYQRAAGFDRARKFTPWLFGIVRRLAVNRRAREARRLRLLRLWSSGAGDGTKSVDNDVERSITARLDAESLTHALRSLPPMQRACFELVVLRGFSSEEAAEMHGITESTVRQHVYRARRALRTYV